MDFAGAFSSAPGGSMLVSDVSTNYANRTMAPRATPGPCSVSQPQIDRTSRRPRPRRDPRVLKAGSVGRPRAHRSADAGPASLRGTVFPQRHHDKRRPVGRSGRPRRGSTYDDVGRVVWSASADERARMPAEAGAQSPGLSACGLCPKVHNDLHKPTPNSMLDPVTIKGDLPKRK